jgi:carboxypeptidase family protein
MKFRRFLISLSIATALLALSISEVKACTCKIAGPPCEEYSQSQAVFAGKVIKKSMLYVEEGEGDSRHKYQQVLVRFSIEQVFKGVAGDEVEIVTGMGGGDCGYHFKDGERYVVYANRSGQDKSRLYSGICNRIKLVAEADEDFAYFRAIPEAGTGSLVYGRVKKLTMALGFDNRYQETYLDNIKVTIEGNGRKFETTTNKDGYYQVSGLAPGRYNVNAGISDGQNSQSQSRVDIVDRGCAARDFSLYVNGQIGGRVFNENDNPLPNIRVDIISAKDAQDISPKGKWGYTDKDGHYKIDWLPPGDYYLGVGLVGANSNLCPYPRTLLSDFGDAKKPKVVSLEEGQKIEDQNISVPSFTPDVEFEVEVVWPDGSPVEAAVVAVHSDGSIAQVEVQKDPNGKKGHYLVKAFKACSYLVTGFTYGHPGEPGGGTQWHDEIKFDSSANLAKPIRLTLSKPGFCTHLTPK